MPRNEGDDKNQMTLTQGLLFVDDLPREIQEMLQEVTDESESQALEMNKSIAKVMIKTTFQYRLNVQIEHVESYIYQAQRHSPDKKSR